MSPDVRDNLEMRISSGYQVTDSIPMSDMQLIAFKKFNQRFSAFIMTSSRAGLCTFRRWYSCGKLNEFLEETMNNIVQGVRIRWIHWSAKDFARCNDYFLVRERPLMSNASTPSSSLPQASPSAFFNNQPTCGIITLHFCSNPIKKLF